jgi:uncharacterized membrane protein
MSPFDPRAFLLARHAQHVVLIHFPIALFIIAVMFDVLGAWRRSTELARVAYYNFWAAAVTSVPALLTGLIAWQWALKGHRLKGILLLHLIFAASSSFLIWCVWFMERRSRRREDSRRNLLLKFGLEFVGVALLALTGHLGGFLSGVNGGQCFSDESAPEAAECY